MRSLYEGGSAAWFLLRITFYLRISERSRVHDVLGFFYDSIKLLKGEKLLRYGGG